MAPWRLQRGNVLLLTTALMVGLMALALGSVRYFRQQSQNLLERRLSHYGVLQARSVAETAVNYVVWSSQGHQWNAPGNWSDTFQAAQSFDIDVPGAPGDFGNHAGSLVAGATITNQFNTASFTFVNRNPGQPQQLMATASIGLRDARLDWGTLKRGVAFDLTPNDPALSYYTLTAGSISRGTVPNALP